MDYYDPSDCGDDTIVVGAGPVDGFYWLRLRDNQTGEIEDIPIHGKDVIYWWTVGIGRCDCVRARAIATIRGQQNPDLPCGFTRFRLVGIWDRAGNQIHEGDEF